MLCGYFSCLFVYFLLVFNSCSSLRRYKDTVIDETCVHVVPAQSDNFRVDFPHSAELATKSKPNQMPIRTLVAPVACQSCLALTAAQYALHGHKSRSWPSSGNFCSVLTAAHAPQKWPSCARVSNYPTMYNGQKLWDSLLSLTEGSCADDGLKIMISYSNRVYREEL